MVGAEKLSTLWPRLPLKELDKGLVDVGFFQSQKSVSVYVLLEIFNETSSTARRKKKKSHIIFP